MVPRPHSRLEQAVRLGPSAVTESTRSSVPSQRQPSAVCLTRRFRPNRGRTIPCRVAESTQLNQLDACPVCRSAAAAPKLSVRAAGPALWRAPGPGCKLAPASQTDSYGHSRGHTVTPDPPATLQELQGRARRHWRGLGPRLEARGIVAALLRAKCARSCARNVRARCARKSARRPCARAFEAAAGAR